MCSLLKIKKNFVFPSKNWIVCLLSLELRIDFSLQCEGEIHFLFISHIRITNCAGTIYREVHHLAVSAINQDNIYVMGLFLDSVFFSLFL